MLVMAVHKVPQDVEADDKFLGPLSFKQFLFFGGAGIGAYLTFLTFIKVWPISIVFALPTIVFAVMAIPWSKEQPTELFLASRIRFLIKPRKRIWNQSGVKDLVNITVPVRAVHVYSDGLSQGEVRNRLSALATMVDSRGWAVKNIHSTYGAVTYGAEETSDRLVDAPVTIDEKSTIVDSAPDVFDDSAGTIARQFDTMIEQSEQSRRSATMRLVEEARNRSNGVAPPEPVVQAAKQPAVTAKPAQQIKLPDTANEQNQDFWFMHQQAQPADPSLSTFQSTSVIAPGQAPTPMQVQMSDNSTTGGLSEQELLAAVQKKHERDALQTSSKHEKVINPYGTVPETLPATVQTEATSTMTPTPNPDILNLSRSNDLSVETLARQAKKKKDLDDGEVVISLH